MKRVIPIFLFVVLSLMLFSRCTQQGRENNPNDASVRSVSIVAQMQYNNQVLGRLRAGEVKDDHSTWKEASEAATAAEKAIHDIFLFVYPKGSTDLMKVYFYYPEGEANPLAGLANLDPDMDVRSVKSSRLIGSSEVRMALELKPGDYNFVIIANSTAAINEVKVNGKITDPRTLQEESQVFTTADLEGSNRKYLPMVGQAELNVPDSRTDAGNRALLTPAIDLERVHARVEFRLTTAKNDMSDYLQEFVPDIEVKGLNLINEHTLYTVLPAAGDFTVTAKNTTTKLQATALASSTPKVGRADFSEGTDWDQDGKLDKFIDRLLPDKDGCTVCYIYVAPYALATGSSDALSLSFTVRYPAHTEDTVYTIPLKNPNVVEPQASETRRNTIYRVRAKIEGPDLLIFDYEVGDWVSVDVDIPW